MSTVRDGVTAEEHRSRSIPGPLRPGRGPTLLTVGSISALSALSALSAVVLLRLTGGLEPPAVGGLPDPGVITRWGLPAAAAARDLAFAAVTGLLLVVVALLEPLDRRGDLSATQAHLLTRVGWASLLWAGCGFAEFALTYSDLSAEPVQSVGPMTLLQFATSVEAGRALAFAATAALVVALTATYVRRMSGAAFLLGIVTSAGWALATTGHAAGDADHDVAVTTQFLHVGSAAVWVGGLLTLVVLRRRRALALVTVQRWSRVAGWAWALVALTGSVAVWLRLDGIGDLLSPYGGLVGLKTTGLLLLGFAGYLHRRHVLTRWGSGGSWFARLVTVELVLMAATFGAAVALSRSEPPATELVPLDSATALLGYPMPPPLDAAQWFTQWRLDPLWGTAALVLLVTYHRGARRLRQRGDRWSRGRTAAWTVGCFGLFWATSGAPGVYGEVLFSMHMVQHMTIATAVPAFLVLGAPVTLALRALQRRTDASWGPREWLIYVVHSWPAYLLGNPVVAASVFITGLVGFYYSPLFELSLETHTGHVVMTAHFLVAGYLFANAVCGVDPGPPRPPYPLRVLLLMTTFGFHAFFSISLMASSEVLAESWFAQLGREWGPDLLRDQYVGASLGWGLGDYPLAVLAAALLWSWVRADARERRRRDRKVDREGDRELDRYNDRLAALAGRGVRREDGAAGGSGTAPTQPSGTGQ